MARILYSLSGLGYGHATRGKPILEEIGREHSVIILTDRYAKKYLSKYFDNIREICTETMEFSNNRVDVLRTAVTTLKQLPKHAKSLVRIWKLIRSFKPDIIINDFTFALNLMGLLFRIPVISIDNESIVTSAGVDIPKGRFWSYLRTFLIVGLITSRAEKRLIPSFFQADAKNSKKTVLCRPVLRKEVEKLAPARGNHILVYRFGSVRDDLIKVLAGLPEKFIVYGMKNSRHANITYREFNDDNYLKDLASCRAIISYGGFSLTTEALRLQKPVLAIPIAGQFEQELNAHYIQRMGYGECSRVLDRNVLRNFVKNLGRYRKNLSKHTNQYPSLISVLKKEISLLTS